MSSEISSTTLSILCVIIFILSVAATAYLEFRTNEKMPTGVLSTLGD